MPVFLLLLILLVSIPLAELYVLIEIGRSIGAATTIALVILTAVLGAWLLRGQGLATIHRAQAAINAGELPALEMIEGLILLITGVMLLTPGFITDALGFICLLPWVRRRLAMQFVARVIVRAPGGAQAGGPWRGPGQGPGHGPSAGPHTIDGDYEVENSDQSDRDRLN